MRNPAPSAFDRSVKLDGAGSFFPKNRVRGAALWFGLTAAAAATAACSAGPAPEPLEVPRTTIEGLDAELSARVDRMRGAYSRGDEDQARTELEGVREMSIPSSLEDYLTQFEALLDGRALSRGLERQSTLEPDRDPVTLGDPMTIRMTLRCDSVGGKSAEVVIPAQVGGGLFSSRAKSETRILATVTTRDLDSYGGEKSRTDTLLVAARGDLVIPAGGVYTLEFSFEGLTSEGIVARFVGVGAEIIPAETRFDGEVVYLTRIALPGCDVLALPGEHVEFASDPLTSLARILERHDNVADRSILPCALMVPADRREDATLTLASKLIGAGQARSLAIIAALRELTGDRERGLDRAAWVGFASKILTAAKR